MSAVAVQFQDEHLFKPSYSYTGKVLGFLLGEVSLFFMLFPFADFFVTFGKWINLTSVTNAMNTGFALLSLAYMFFAAKKFRIDWNNTLVLGLIIFLIIASAMWVHPAMKSNARSFSIRTILTIVQALVIVKIFFEKGDEYLFDVLKRFAIIIGILSCLSIALFPSESSWTIDDTGRKQAFFASPNNLGQFLSFAFLIINFYKRSNISWWLLIPLNLMLIYQAIECDSKTSLTGALICIVLYHIRFLIRPFLIFVIGAGFYLPIYTQQFAQGEAEKIEFAKRDMSFTGRSDVWAIMQKDLKDYNKQMLGFGYGGYWGEKDYHPKARIHQLEWEPHQGHNGYLDIQINAGIIGAILFLAFLFFYFTNIFKTMNNLNIVMLFISVIFCINNITETSFFRGKHFYFVLMMLIFWYTNLKMARRDESGEDSAELASGQTGNK